MSFSLCYFQDKNLKLEKNQIEIPFNFKLLKFNFKPIKSLSNRLSSDAKKRIKVVQASVDKLITQSQQKLNWMRGLQKLNIILLLGFIIGIYYMNLDGIDTENETFQAGVYILAASGLLIIMIQIICIFIWHHTINYIYHEISLLLLNETQRYGNIISWKLARNCSYIIFQYNSLALLSQSQQIDASQRSYLNNQSEEIITKKGGYISRTSKEPYEKVKQLGMYQNKEQNEEDEDKENYKNHMISPRNEQEMITIGNNNQENEEEMLNDDSSQNSNKIKQNQNQSKSNKQSKVSQEIPKQLSHVKGISNASNKQDQDKNRQQSNQYQQKQQGMINFFSEQPDIDEEIGSEKTDQNNLMLKYEQNSGENTVNLITNSNKGVPLVLQYQNEIDSTHQINQRFQTDHSLFANQLLKDRSSWQDSYSPQRVIQTHSQTGDIESHAEQDQQKKSKIQQTAHEGDETPIGEDDEEIQSENNKKQSKSQKQSKFAIEQKDYNALSSNEQVISLNDKSYIKQEEQTDQELESEQKHKQQLIDLRDD